MRRAALVAGMLAGCGDNTDEAVRCAAVAERSVLGLAAPYEADVTLAMRDAELAGSRAARRAAAWQVVERVLAPVPLADPTLAARFGAVMPTWQTWYARDDLERTFKHLFRELDAASRSARAPIDPTAGFAWNVAARGSDPAWSDERYAAYVDAIDTVDEAHGVGGVARVRYSPGAAGHLLRQYAALDACRSADAPPPYAGDPVRPGRRVVAREVVELASCEPRVLGPYQTAAGDVVVTADGATVQVGDCVSDERCVVDGGGPIHVTVRGEGRAEVTIDHVTADVALPSCLGEAMPRDAVLVKADWRRALPGDRLPVYDADRHGDTWQPIGSADPSSTQIYTAELPGTGQRFRLPALHVASKELDQWMWITLWFAPDGGDPDAPATLAGPWRNYRMCVVTDFLDAAGPSACSNPYLEEGRGNATTNCIGCHQHGGTTLTAEQILALPGHGVARVRNNFPADYSFAVRGGGGDDVSAFIEAELDHWDARDP